MKIKAFIQVGLWSVLALGGAGLASSAQAAVETDKPALQLQVEVPFVFDWMYERDVAEALASRMSETFRRRGYEGGFEEIEPREKTSADRPMLSVNLMRWRLSRSGMVECVFTAVLHQADGSKQSLGAFSATEAAWGTRSRWHLITAFENAAESAADQLWRKMSERSLLPTGPAQSAS